MILILIMYDKNIQQQLYVLFYPLFYCKDTNF